MRRDTKGGVALSQENQSSLRFSLEESLWFRKGQEVEELVSISLDPDITIQENDQYVNIRGSLELTGEYKTFNESSQSEEVTGSEQKYVQKVDVREEGNCEFSHRFPVDITIPNNRIQSIYDIDVVVESFDYSFPERSCLKLSAELTISGLYGTQINEPAAEETEEIEVFHRSASNHTDDIADEEPEEVIETDYSQLFIAEARKQPEEEENFIEENNFPTFTYQTANFPYTQNHDYAFEERNDAVQHVEISTEKQTIIEEEKLESFEKHHSFSEESSSSSSSSDESHPKKTFKNKIVEKITKKKSMSLTEFFARKEEGSEDQAKLKVCIVQKGDTLDRLAERYDVSMQNLLKVNQLEINQTIQEGQVLYIPVALAKKY
jgi:stage VI sporulation protein D